MRKCIPNRELDELGDGLVRSFLKKSGIRRLPKCVDIEGLANSLGLTVILKSLQRTITTKSVSWQTEKRL